MAKTPNHDYNVPAKGTTAWHTPLNENFRQYDTDIEVRDADGEKTNYLPKAGAKFFAIDTGKIYIGDGSNWKHLQTTGPTPKFDGVNTDGTPLGIGTNAPSTPVDIAGQNNWNLDNTDGDVRIGNDQYRLAIGVALGGVGHGTVNMRAKGGVNHLNLGAGTNGTTLHVGERNVGIGTRNPRSKLHVTDTLGQDVVDPGGHVATIENESSTSSADVLLLQTGASDPGGANNYVTFVGGDSAVGRIEGDGSGGISFRSGGADYAELLPKQNADDEFEGGEVIGVHKGEISSVTRTADTVMVVSHSSIVTGNDPGEGDREDYEPVAFTGQVPVKVRGPVDSGDILVASGNNDGTAVAVSPDEYIHDGGASVGQAWEDDEDEGITEVTTAVGVDNSIALSSTLRHGSDGSSIDNREPDPDQVRDGFDESPEPTDPLTDELVEIVREKDSHIEDLKAETEQLHDRVASLETRIASLDAGQPAETGADD